MRLRLIFIFTLFSLVVRAQTITAIEYFFDSDPGFGSGTAVTITPAATVNHSFAPSVAALADGFHILYFRAKDNNNRWSTTHSRPIYKLSAAQVAPTAPNINKIEYFVDNDPGFGAGTNVPVTPATSFTDLAFAVPLSAVSDGFHTLHVRTRDANNNWSTTFNRPFFKLNSATVAPAPNINKIEYFVDTDPGFGAGTNVPVTPATSINDLAFAVPLSAVADGFHTLHVRTRDANNNWSTTFNRPFYKLNSAAVAPAPNINKIEYFIDTDPGFGAGTNVPVTPAVSINDQAIAVPLSSVSDGFHTLWIRTRDANNNWSASYSRPFYKLNSSVAAPIPNVNKLEYFVDADPGYGAGVNVPVTPNTTISNINVTIPVTSLAVGSHVLTVRARDVNNQWSVVAIKSFSVCNHPGTTITAATSITSSGFTANWAESPGSIGYQLDVSTDNFNTFVSGYNAKAIAAPATSFNVTGLSQATTFQYRVRAVAGCVSVESNTLAVTTLATPPTAQPTNLQFSSVTATTHTAFFTAPATAPTGYLVVRKAASSPTFVPVNNTTYTVGQAVGDGTVAYVGALFLFNETGLTSNTRYYYDVFAFNQANGATSYLTTSPLENSVLTMAIEPTAQPTNLQFSAVTDNSLTVTFTAATGSPGGYLVLRKSGSAPTAVPVDGTTYTTAVSTDDVVHNGPATTFNQTGLVQNTEYFYTVYAFNGGGSSINYRTVSPLQGSRLTPIVPPATPTNLLFTNVTQSAMTLSWTGPGGNPTGYLVIRRVASSPTFAPQLNTTYSAGQTVGDGVVAYFGTATTFHESGLTPSTVYAYDVYAYNQQSTLVSYQTVGPLENSKSTFTAEPTAQPTGILLTEPTATSIKVSFNAASPAPAGYIVIRKAGSATTVNPEDGVAYTQGQNAGDGVAAYVGTDLTFNDTGLTSGTTYHYTILSFNGTAGATNYNTSVNANNASSLITIPAKPVFANTTAIGQQTLTLNWTAAGATSYRVDVSKDNFATFVTGFNDATVTATTVVVNGLEAGIVYQFRVRAVNTSGVSVNSDPGQQITVPPTPTLLAAEGVEQTTMTIRWNAVTGATAYHVDVSTDNFATFISNYNNKTLGPVTAEVVNNLTPGTVYQYRLRASNEAGTTPSSNPTGSQLLKPATPEVIDVIASNPATFTAKWRNVASATEYRLDVSLLSSNFNPSLPNYDNLRIEPNGASEGTALVQNLIANTGYVYRVRAVNASGTSPSSAPMPVSTTPPPSGVDLKLSDITAPQAFTGTAEVSATVDGGQSPYVVNFYYRHIAAKDYSVRPVTSSTKIYRTNVDNAMLDDLGMDFYFEVTDATGLKVSSDEGYIFRSIPAAGLTIPFTKFGGTADTYEMFSIPYEVSDNLVGSIFKNLGEVDKTMWRLVRWEGGRNNDLSLVGRIEPGKGYWFNRLENVAVSFSGGTTAKRTQAEPFVLSLERGWNQIGNPYPYAIDWADVLSENPSVVTVGKLKVFNSTGQHLNDESASLKAWAGAFVHNGSDKAIELKIPVTVERATGGRQIQRTIPGSRLDADEWFVPIKLQHGATLTATAGIGMHPQASNSYDRFDDFVVPRFVNYLEFYSRHDEYFTPKFAGDVVSTSDAHTWELAFESNGSSDKATLEWSNDEFGLNEAVLMLYDVSRNIMIDMRKVKRYEFTPAAGQSFRVLFGGDMTKLSPDLTVLGEAYPNPFRSSVSIPFTIAGNAQPVSLQVYNLMGQRVRSLINEVKSKGLYTAEWDSKDTNGEGVASGLYIMRLQVGDEIQTSRIIKK